MNWTKDMVSPSSHEMSHERDTGRSIEINHVVPHVAFVDHVISQSSSSALANYGAYSFNVAASFLFTTYQLFIYLC